MKTLPWSCTVLVAVALTGCFDETGGGNGGDGSGTGSSATTTDDGGGDGSGDTGSTASDGGGGGTSGDSGGGSETGSGTGTGTGTDTATTTGSSDVMVIAPNGGEAWSNGATEEIVWSSSAAGDVDIELWKDGAKVDDIATGEANDGSFMWTIPGSVVNAADYRVRVVDAVGADDSDADFAVAAWRWVTNVDVENRVSTDFSSKSLVIELRAADFDYDHVNADGSDLRFSTSMDQADGFDVPHYIQDWNPGGVSYVWFQMASLPANSVTTVYMFTGNELATNSTEDFAAVFPQRWVSAGGEVLSGQQQLNYFEVRAGDTVTIDNNAEILADAVVIDGVIDGTAGGPPGGIGGDETTLGTDGQGTAPGTVGLFCGGGGGGHGGVGGDGGRDNTEMGGQGGGTYGDTNLSFAAAPGSGGGGGDQNMLSGVAGGDGGAGGASIGLQGTGRVKITGDVLVDGGDGEVADASGGGGSGGKISILAGYLNVPGRLSAAGGDGGGGMTMAADGGGGGGGGRIVIAHEHMPVPDVASITHSVDGGLAGNAPAQGDDGAAGTYTTSMIMIAAAAILGTETAVVFP